MVDDYYELFKLKPNKQFEDRRFRSYRYLQEHGISVRSYDYDLVLRGDVDDSENVKMLQERLERELGSAELPQDSHTELDDTQKPASPCINVSDVLAITKAGLTTAYYVDPTRLILLPDFFHQPSSGALITIDTDNYPLDGRKGSWMTIDTLRLNGRNLFLMQSKDYGRDAPYVIVDEAGKEIAADKNGFTEATIEQIRKSLKELESHQIANAISDPGKKPKLEVWQQYFENGEYLRAAEISEEQNYNMIDGTANNRAPKRSIIERLQEKQAEVKIIPTRMTQSELIQDNQIERNRK